MTASAANRVRRRLPDEVAAVAVRKDETFVTIVDERLSEPIAHWAAELAVSRRNESRGGVYGTVMRKEIPAVA